MPGLRPMLADHSGGLTYHWRALRYHNTLWAPFCKQVGHWLLAWRPPQRHLLIVGPSAGYSLEPGFLAGFDEVTILEPDPLARRLLARRFPRVVFRHGTLDCMSSLEGPDFLAAEYPDCAILFSNVIGQRLEDAPDGWAQALREALSGHSWASYHDVISTEVAPAVRAPVFLPQEHCLEDMLGRFWSSGGELVLHDHLTFSAIPVHEYAIWQLLPSRFHVIGWHQVCGHSCAGR